MSLNVTADDSLAAGSDSFWEVEGYRRTVKRIEDGLQQCGELMKLVQERADIEKEYAKRLKAWSKKWNEHFDKGTEYGTNKSTWKGVLNEADRIADIHLEIKEHLMNDIQTQIKDWKNENYKKQMVGGCKEAKTFEEEFRKAQKPWAKRLEKVIKSKKDYHLACKLERTASNQENNGKNSTEFSPDQVKKLQEKVDKCRKEVDTSRERYKQSLIELNSCNAKYVEDMTEVFYRTQEFENRRLAFYKKMLYDLHNRLDLTQIKALPEIYAQFRETVSRSDPAKDLKWFSQFHGADMPMAWPTFEEYSPEFTDIARKKCTDLADTGSVMLKRITTSRYNEEFGPGEYSPDLHSIAGRDKSRGAVAIDSAIRLTSVQQGTPATAPPSYYSNTGSSYSADAMYSSAVYNNADEGDDDEFYQNVSMTTGSTSGSASAAARPTSAAVSNGGGVPVKALFDYQGQEDDELSFRAGDVFFKIKDRDDQGWCTGRKDGKIGLYPDNYVQLQ